MASTTPMHSDKYSRVKRDFVPVNQILAAVRTYSALETKIIIKLSKWSPAALSDIIKTHKDLLDDLGNFSRKNSINLCGAVSRMGEGSRKAASA